MNVQKENGSCTAEKNEEFCRKNTIPSLSSQDKCIKKIYFEVQLTTHNSLQGGDHLQAFKLTA